MKPRTGGYLAAFAALAVAVTVAGCTQLNDSDREAPSTPSASMPGTHAALPTPEISAVPSPQPGMTTLLTVPPTSGPAAAGTVQVEAGAVWLNADCIGGKLEIIVNEIRLPIKCSESEITPFGNRISYSTSRQLTIRVETSQDVRWSLRVEQEAA